MTSSLTTTAHCITKNVTNQREHWTTRNRRDRKVKAAVAAAMLVIRHKAPPLPVDVVLTRIAPRMLDKTDNLPAALKAAIDAVAKFYSVDDRETDRIRFRCDQRRGRPKEYAVEVSIEPRRT